MHTNVDHQNSTAAIRSSPPLQRGKACLSCRRRKMRCDGAKPVCSPCLRGERAEDCEYTDGQRRPRTLTLEEDIARLKARVQELENPEETTPSVQLHAPYAIAGPSTHGSTSQARVHAPVSESYHYHAGSEIDLGADVHPGDALSIISPYAAEIGLFLDLDRLRVQGTHISHALQSALTLWSVHITSMSEPDYAHAPERIQTLLSNLLSQTQTQLTSALSTVDVEPDPAILLHVIQTGVLLAYYMQRIGQLVGARYYASGTWALSMVLRLHRSPHFPTSPREGEGQAQRGFGTRGGSTQVYTSACSAILVMTLDGIEAEERVRAFWAVYTLDRWFSTLNQGPSQSLPMNGNSTTVPWPDAGAMDEAINVVQHLLNDPNHDFTQDGPSAMQAKASVLLGEATAVAASYVADHTISQSPVFRARFGTLDTLLQRCSDAAMMVATGHQSRTREQAQALVTVHLIAFALVTLHRPFISAYRPYQRRCADAAVDVVRALDHVSELETRVGQVGPVYAIVWTALCLALHDEVLCLRARSGTDPARRREEREITGAIRKLASMLSALSQDYPSQFFAIKIETMLPILESIAV